MNLNLLTYLLGILLPNAVFTQSTPLRSFVETYDLTTNERRVIHIEDGHLEAPNWAPTNDYLLVNGSGKLYRIPLTTGPKQLIPTGFADKCNNDHGISPDGREIVISHYDQPGVAHGDHDFRTSTIYRLPIDGGTPRRVTTQSPAFWHSWSSDGKMLAYVGLRNGEWDLYTIPANGGPERRLTSASGLQDGPDYSPDGKYIYYNSFESGSMEIWRIKADGSSKEQLTDDSYSNWFPHPSPDGKGFIFLSYLQDQGEAHPPLKSVALRYYDLQNRTITRLTTFLGGQGTINVPSWSPDGQRFAFVRYEQLPPSTTDKHLYVLLDGDMPASAYIDGRLGQQPEDGTDLLQILDAGTSEMEIKGSVAVTNSVRRWPNSADLLKTDGRKYLIIAEQDGVAPLEATTLRDIKRGRFLSLVDVSDATAPRVIDVQTFSGIPAAVAVHPSQPIFALSFIGNDSLIIGTVAAGRIRILSRSQLVIQEAGNIQAIPHFTWHPSGAFAAVTLAGNDRVTFLRHDASAQEPFTVWGNTLRTPPLPGVGYFTHNGRFFLYTSIGLTGDEEQSAYGDQSSILTIVRFDSTALPDSPSTRRDDGRLTYLAPAVQHTVSGKYPFGQGYVETFAISPDDRHLVGLNMRGSWLPRQFPGRTSGSRLEIFTLDATAGKASWIQQHDFLGILPECIAFAGPRQLITTSFDHRSPYRGRGSVDRWQLLEDSSHKFSVGLIGRKWLPRGVHYFLSK